MSEDRGESRSERDAAKPDEGDPATADHRAGPLELVATALSALLVAGILGVLIWDAFHPNAPPAFTTKPGRVAIANGSYRVPVNVRNSGDDAAKAVVVHLQLVASDSVLAESDLTIDWLPGNTSKELVGLFARPASAPMPTGVRAEVRGYVTP
jgi:uncharacterized protein (TIGR02588 family)